MKKKTKIITGTGIVAVLLISGLTFNMLSKPVDSKSIALDSKTSANIKSAENIDAKSTNSSGTKNTDKNTNGSDSKKDDSSSENKETSTDYNPNEIGGEKTSDEKIFVKKNADVLAYSKENGEYVDGETDQAVLDQIAKDKAKANETITELNKASGNYVTEHFMLIPGDSKDTKTTKKVVVKNDDGSYTVSVSGKDVTVSADEYKKADSEIKKEYKQAISEEAVAKAAAFSKVNDKGVVESYKMTFN